MADYGRWVLSANQTVVNDQPIDWTASTGGGTGVQRVDATTFRLTPGIWQMIATCRMVTAAGTAAERYFAIVSASNYRTRYAANNEQGTGAAALSCSTVLQVDTTTDVRVISFTNASGGGTVQVAFDGTSFVAFRPEGQQGPPGPQGIPGANGAPGAPGAPGVKGDPGAKGATGAAGAPGVKGDTGARGAPGVAGADGATGAPGPRGVPGEAGPPGERGEAGEDGTDGVDGAPGPAGVPGLDGNDGAPGVEGPPGPRGVPGVAGAAGVDGLPGPPGVDGDDGAPGPRGAVGEPGPRGAAGRDGVDGPDGLPGATGAPGPEGPPGPAGPPGEDGQDGAVDDAAVSAAVAAYLATNPATITRVPAPTGRDIARFLGRGAQTELVTLATMHVQTIADFAHAYTRGNGFTDDGIAPDIAGAIITATARLVAHPEQIDRTIGSVRTSGGWRGWTLGEQAVLNRYRRTAG